MLVAGVLVLLDALGIAIQDELFWAILLLLVGALVLLRALGRGGG